MAHQVELARCRILQTIVEGAPIVSLNSGVDPHIVEILRHSLRHFDILHVPSVGRIDRDTEPVLVSRFFEQLPGLVGVVRVGFDLWVIVRRSDQAGVGTGVALHQGLCDGIHVHCVVHCLAYPLVVRWQVGLVVHNADVHRAAADRCGQRGSVGLDLAGLVQRNVERHVDTSAEQLGNASAGIGNRTEDKLID